MSAQIQMGLIKYAGFDWVGGRFVLELTDYQGAKVIAPMEDSLIKLLADRVSNLDLKVEA